MKKPIQTLFTALTAITFAFALSSCGSKHESLIEDQIKLMNSYADEYESDPKSDKLAKIDEKIEKLQKEGEDVGEPSEADAKKLKEKYEDAMVKAIGRYTKAKMGGTMLDMGNRLEGLIPEGLGK